MESSTNDVFVIATSIGRFAGSASFCVAILGFRCAPPQALCRRPLRGLTCEKLVCFHFVRLPNARTIARARSGSIGFDQIPSCFIEEPTINASASA